MQTLLAWLLWLAVDAVGGFVVFLWSVFGLAAAGTVQSPAALAFMATTAIGGGAPLVASAVAMYKCQYRVGLTYAVLIGPGVLVLFIALVAVLHIFGIDLGR